MGRPTVLLTGAAGYIGSTLVGHLLDARYRVIGVDNLTYDNGPALLPYVGHPHFSFERLDVQDEAPVNILARKADVVIPLAALVGAPLCEREPERARAVNRAAVESLARTLSPHQLLLYPNTNSGYGQTDGNSFVTEEDPLTPISVYGETKCAAERAVLDHPNGIAFRLATVFGASPRMRLDLMVNDFTRHLAARKRQADDAQKLIIPFAIFEPHFKRNFVGVRDVCRAFVHMLTYTGPRGVFNLGLPTANLTKMELAHKVCDAIGLSREAVVVGEGKDPDRRNYLVSNDKVLRAGFKFEQSLEAGIREVARVCDLVTHEQAKSMRNY